MPRRRDPHTADLLSWQPEPVAVSYGGEVAGRGRLDNQIARVIAQALRDAKDDDLPRDEIAQRMSDWLGRSVSPSMLDKWASEASEGHRIPLDAFLALIQVTGAQQLVGFVADMFGLAAVPAKYVGLVELHLLEEHEREVAARKVALQTKWRAGR